MTHRDDSYAGLDRIITQLRDTGTLDDALTSSPDDAPLRELTEVIQAALDSARQASPAPPSPPDCALTRAEVSTLSHDLRSSLNSLLLLARMLIDADPQELSDRHLSAARMIYEAGEEMLATVDVLRKQTGLDA